MADEQDLHRLLEKIRELKKSGEIDLSTEEDLSLAIMNLVSLEEHFFFTAEKTGKNEYLNFLKEIREIRKELLGKLITQTEGETWCISKHLLAAAMRLIEVGTKKQGEDKKEEAEKMFKIGYRLYNLFWALRLKLINLKGLKKVDEGQLNHHDIIDTGKPWTYEDIITKLVDCCQE